MASHNPYPFTPAVYVPIQAPQAFTGTSPADLALVGVISQVRQLISTSGANANIFEEDGTVESSDIVRADGPASIRTLVTLVNCSSIGGDAADIVVTLANGSDGQNKTFLLVQPLTRCRIVTARGSVLLDDTQQIAKFTFAAGRWVLLPELTPAGVPQQMVAYRAVGPPYLPPPVSSFVPLGAHVSFTGDRVWAWSADAYLGVWTANANADLAAVTAQGPGATTVTWSLGVASSAGPVPGLAGIRGAWIHANDAQMLVWDYRAGDRSRLVWCTVDGAGGGPNIGPGSGAASTGLEALGLGPSDPVHAAPDLSFLLVGRQIYAQNPLTRTYAPSAGAVVPGPGPAFFRSAAISALAGVLVVAAPGEVTTYAYAAGSGLAWTASLAMPAPPEGSATVYPGGFGAHAVAVSPTGRTLAVVLDGGSFLVYADGRPSASALVTVPAAQNIDSIVVRDGVIVVGSRAAGTVWTFLPQEGGAAPSQGLGWQAVSAMRGRGAIRDPDFGASVYLSLDTTTLLVPSSITAAASGGELFLFS